MAKKIISVLLICTVLFVTNNPISAIASDPGASGQTSNLQLKDLPPSHVQDLEELIVEALFECAKSCTQEKCGGKMDCLDQCDMSKIIPKIAELAQVGYHLCMENCVDKTCEGNMEDEKCMKDCGAGECNTKDVQGLNALLYPQCVQGCTLNNCKEEKNHKECVDKCKNEGCKTFLS